MQNFKNGKIADMHTHSENSHDSTCKIEDMYASQIKRGTEIFAVTDHFDTASHLDYDVFSPIKKAYETVSELNEKHGNENILAGIEISEGFWYPKISERALKIADFDVVIGSVHLVQYKELEMAYSKIDFSALPRKTVEEYVDAYFDDMIKMTEESDFDVLAHLTCPLRYINGKYGLGIDAEQYSGKIDGILRRIIENNTALEVNTSSYKLLGTFMPDTDILKRYYEMGGRLLTVGSDAHIAENASDNFDKAIKIIKETGFENIYYFKGRKPLKIKL